MLALLALATTPSGRWVGLDGLLSQLWHPVRGSSRRRDRDAIRTSHVPYARGD